MVNLFDKRYQSAQRCDLNKKISSSRPLIGTAKVPGDKSISHRALIFGAIANGETRIKNLLQSGDVLSTKKCLEALGVKIDKVGDEFLVSGRGKRVLKKPSQILQCENSGTTMRLLMALLAAENITATLTGDDSLSKRPMGRIAAPLKAMGANIRLSDKDFSPIEILQNKDGRLEAIQFELKIASAQLKTALIIAGLYATGVTILKGKIQSRDHTERLLKDFGVELKLDSGEIRIEPGQELQATSVVVPGDPSSAAFWLAAGSLVSNSVIEIHNVSLNPTRTGLLRALKKMGASIEVFNVEGQNESYGSLRVKSARLKSIHITEPDIAAIIDELPIFAILASQAEGKTIVKGAGELRVKESDRLAAIASNLRHMGAKIDIFEDGFSIEGPQKLKGARIESNHDHRIAMSFSIAALVAEGESEICDVDSVGISYPEFYSELDNLLRGNIV